MNNYIVPLTEVMKYIHPFRDSLFNPHIYTKEIDIAIVDPNFTQTMEIDKKLIIDSIAYKITHYYPQEIDLDFTQKNIDNKEGQVITTNLIDLAAAIYRHEKNIVCSIKGNRDTVLSLLGIDMGKPDNIVLPDEPIDLEFLWNIEDIGLQETWNDVDFVTKYLQQPTKISTQANDLVREVMKFAADDVWNSPLVLEAAFKKTSELFKILPSSLYLKESVLDFCQTNLKAFQSLWTRIYKDIYKESGFNQEMIAIYKGDLNDMLLKNLDTLQNKIFKDESFVKNLMVNMDLLIEVFNLISPEVKYSKEILNLVMEKNSLVNSISPKVTGIFRSLPQEYINDIKWCQETIKDFSPLLEWHTINYERQDFGINNLYSSWIDKKEHVLDIVSEKHNAPLYALFSKMPENLQDDNELIKHFMDNYPLVYNVIPEEKRSVYTKQFLMEYNIEWKRSLSNYISDIDICLLNDKEIFMHLIEQKQVSWFMNVQFDKKWLNDLPLVKKVLLTNDDTYAVGGIKYALAQFNREEIEQLVIASKNAYVRLPAVMRNDKDIALLSMKTHKHSPVLNHNLFWDKDFCIEVLGADSLYINKIPEKYWQEKDFILKLCKAIDDNVVPSSIFKEAPAYVKPFFDAFNVTQGYTNFMEKYFLKLELSKNLPMNNVVAKKNKI